MIKLNNCPCGSAWVVIIRGEGEAKAFCTTCNEMGPTGKDADDAARLWNQEQRGKAKK